MSTSGTKGLGGIVNMGFTCYANAVTQAMRHSVKIPWLLEEGRYNTLFQKVSAKKKRELQQNLVVSFAEVVQMLGRCDRGQSVRPGEFWKRLTPAVDDTLYEQLATRAPHDSHEFYLFLLESLHESMATDVEMRILRPPPTTPEERLVYRALESWQREFSKEYSPLVDLFYGLGHWRTVCQACRNVSHRWESFNSLKMSMPVGGLGIEPLTLDDLLEKEKEAESIEGYQCDVCSARTTAHRSYRVWRLPQTLVLVLKRFTPDGRKIHTRLGTLPLNGVVDFRDFFSEDSPERVADTVYSLRSIVDHHGSSAGGHYTAQARNRTDDRWYLYDDEGVMEMGDRGPTVGDTTYMLFLERGGTATAIPSKEALPPAPNADASLAKAA